MRTARRKTKAKVLPLERRFTAGQPVLWLHTLGGGGGSGKRKNEKEPVAAEVMRDDGKGYVQITTPSSGYSRAAGSWVRRDNVVALLSFYMSKGCWRFTSREHEYAGAWRTIEGRERFEICRDDQRAALVDSALAANIWLTIEVRGLKNA